MSALLCDIDSVGKVFGRRSVLEEVSVGIREGVVHGLLGNNGAGKSTLMRLISGRSRPTRGRVRVFGADPFENDAVTRRICFCAENQLYPDFFRVRDVLAAGRLLFPTWDEAYSRDLVEEFELPLRGQVKKLSRGQRSAVGIIAGLASRAPLTVFDEPYLGLDAASRQRFYRRLVADSSDGGRTVILSTHLIDEVADLLERVLVLDHGRLVVDAAAEDLRGRAMSVSGPAELVESFARQRPRMHEENLFGQRRVTLLGPDIDVAAARGLGLDVKPVSLQDFVVQSTGWSAGVGGES